MVECKYTNRYKFTQKLLNLCGLDEDFKQGDNLSYSGCQNVISKRDNLSHHEQTNEQKKKTKVVELKQSNSWELKPADKNIISDEEVLRIYAEKHAKSNIQGYINALKIKGVAADIIRQYREKEGVQKYWDNQAALTSELIRERQNFKGDPMPECFKNLGKKLKGYVWLNIV